MIGPLGEKRTSYTTSHPRHRQPNMAVRGVQWSILATAVLLGFVVVYWSFTILDADVVVSTVLDADVVDTTIPLPPVVVGQPPPPVTVAPPPPPVATKKSTDLECRFVWVGGCKYLRCTGPTMNLAEPNCVPKDATVKDNP